MFSHMGEKKPETSVLQERYWDWLKRLSLAVCVTELPKGQQIRNPTNKEEFQTTPM